MASSYYDIDSILAEEELIPLVNVCKFRYLAHLDPDYIHEYSSSTYTNDDNENSHSNINKVDDDLDTFVQETRKQSQRKARATRISNKYYLADGSSFKMPLWSIQQWVQLSYVRFRLPRHFSRKAREQLQADGVSVDLRKKSERFFMSGLLLLQLMHKTIHSFRRIEEKNYGSRRDEINLHQDESEKLKKTLLSTYFGPRLRKTFDWTLSQIEDDTSSFTKRLTVMELRLFHIGAAASRAHAMWKLYGTRRIAVSETALRANAVALSTRLLTTPKTARREKNLVSPDEDDASEKFVIASSNKRARIN